MKGLTRLTVVFLASVLAASPVAAQEEEEKKTPRPRTKAEYDAYTKLYNEKDMNRRAELAPKFIADFPQSDFRLFAYQLEIQANTALGNHQKVVAAGEKALQEFPEADKQPKMYILPRMMHSYQQLNNSRKTVEIADKLLEVDPNHLRALLTLSLILPGFLPEEEEARAQQLDRALEITQRAKRQVDIFVGGPKPARMTAVQWVKQKADLPAKIHAALGLIHFNKKDYQRSSEEYEKATSLVRGEGVDFYRMGFAYYYQARTISQELAELDRSKKLDSAVKEEKEAQFADLRDKAIAALAKVVVLKDKAPEQVVQSARDELERLYRTRNNDSLEGLELVIAEAAGELENASR